MPAEPRTEAGRALLASLREMSEHQAAGLPYIKPPARLVSTGRDAILAIEAEAHQQGALAAAAEIAVAPREVLPAVNKALAYLDGTDVGVQITAAQATLRNLRASLAGGRRGGPGTMSHRNPADLDAALNGPTFAVRKAALSRIAEASWRDGWDAAVEETAAVLRLAASPPAAPTDTALREAIDHVFRTLRSEPTMAGPIWWQTSSGTLTEALRPLYAAYGALHPATEQPSAAAGPAVSDQSAEAQP